MNEQARKERERYLLRVKDDAKLMEALYGRFDKLCLSSIGVALKHEQYLTLLEDSGFSPDEIEEAIKLARRRKGPITGENGWFLYICKILWKRRKEGIPLACDVPFEPEDVGY